MTLNGAHWHLLVNHFPIIGGLLATFVLGYGLFRRNESIRQLGYTLFVAMSIATVVTNQTGESAEHYLKSINRLNRAIFHEHESAADLANIGMYLTGLLSLLMLVWKRTKQMQLLPILVLPCRCLRSG